MKLQRQKYKVSIGLITLFFLALFQSPSYGLPVYRKLFKQKHQINTSCKLCHQKEGGSSINKYGRSFLKNGLNIAAFSKIQKIDSDRDGVSNEKEIKAGSNPGDRRSTPKKPGKWLHKIEADLIPIKLLKKGYPKAYGFTEKDWKIKRAEVHRIERQLKVKLKDVDKYPTLYFAVKKEGKTFVKYGMAYIIGTKKFMLLLGINPKKEIQFVKLIKAKDSKLRKHKKFFEQFKGQKLNVNLVFSKKINLIKRKEAVSKDIIFSVKKGFLIVNKILSDKKVRH